MMGGWLFVVNLIRWVVVCCEFDRESRLKGKLSSRAKCMYRTSCE